MVLNEPKELVGNADGRLELHLSGSMLKAERYLNTPPGVARQEVF